MRLLQWCHGRREFAAIPAYRFLIPWSRIVPLRGRNDPVNEKGVSFYDDLIDQILSRNIKPIIPLYYWDVPYGIYDR